MDIVFATLFHPVCGVWGRSTQNAGISGNMQIPGEMARISLLSILSQGGNIYKSCKHTHIDV